MAEVLLFHHIQGLTDGVRSFARALTDAGHTVHTPDLFEGRRFETIEAGMSYADEIGFGTLIERARTFAADLHQALVYAGFSAGVMPAQALAQTRSGAKGALFFHSCIPTSEFGAWPAGVPVQVHGMIADPFFAEEGDVDAARALIAGTPDGELFLYHGDRHLFADSSLPSYDEPAAALLTKRVLGFLDDVDRTDPTPPLRRDDPPISAAERETLLGFLDYHRKTLQWKCAGLDARQLATAVVPSTDMTLLGMVRHLTEVEIQWFEEFDGTDPVWPYSSADDYGASWHVDPATVTDADCAEAWTNWRKAVDLSQRVVEANSLDDLSAPRGKDHWQPSLRWIMNHMIEEYARHNGHADLMREAFDGAVGE